MDYIKKLPVAVCGVALGFAALGNLLQSYAEDIRLVCGIISALLLLAYIVKLCVMPQEVRQELSDPISLSVAATFPMAVMLLSVYVKPLIGIAAQVIWFVAIALHIACISIFSFCYIEKFNWKNVHASWFIVYVGIVVASVTAPAYALEASIGTISFWFGFICLAALLVVVSVKYAKHGPIPAPAQSLACIYAAPTSLCVAGYVQSIMPKFVPFLLGMLIVASIIYIASLVWCVRCLTKPFFPSHAAFTFPFVISAIACKQTAACLVKLGQPIEWLGGVATVETIIATVLCVVVLIRLLVFVHNQALAEEQDNKSCLMH